MWEHLLAGMRTRSVDSTFPNGTNYIMLVGWSANLGTSWLQASNTIANVELNDAGYFNNLPGLSFFGESTIGWENPTDIFPWHSHNGGWPKCRRTANCYCGWHDVV